MHPLVIALVAAIELTPPTYPKTTLMADVTWLPGLDAAAPALEWVAGWGAIALDVRHREGEGSEATP